MLPTTWTPEAAKAGVKQEDIEAANVRAAQATQDGYQRAVADARGLCATALQLVEAPGLSGPAKAALQNALDWPITPQHVAEAVRQLRAAVEWGNRDYSLAGMAPVAPPQRRAAEERSRPKVLSIEERLDRIEQRLGIA